MADAGVCACYYCCGHGGDGSLSVVASDYEFLSDLKNFLMFDTVRYLNIEDIDTEVLVIQIESGL